MSNEMINLDTGAFTFPKTLTVSDTVLAPSASNPAYTAQVLARLAALRDNPRALEADNVMVDLNDLAEVLQVVRVQEARIAVHAGALQDAARWRIVAPMIEVHEADGGDVVVGFVPILFTLSAYAAEMSHDDQGARIGNPSFTEVVDEAIAGAERARVQGIGTVTL